MKKEKIIAGGKEYPVGIYLEKRNNTRVSIGRTGVHIRVPFNMPREDMFKEIIRLKRWAIQKLEEKPLEIKQKGSRTYQDGEKLTVGDEEYLIRLFFNPKQSSSAKVNGNTFYLNISSLLPEDTKQKHISVLISRLAARKKKQYIEQRIHTINEKHFNAKVNKIFLKYNVSNWGSCSNHNNINISTRLLFAPDEVIDYICIHELAHLQERGHSAAFWKLVGKAMPDYKEKEKWLKENSSKCWF